MSKSLKRVAAALQAAGIETEILQMPGETRTAADAAREAGCEIDQIAKSIIFLGATSGDVVLFITAGGNRVDPSKASAVAGEPLGRADAMVVREKTGFAIGGVAPLGHLTPSRVYFDPRLLDFATVYAAAGTPPHSSRSRLGFFSSSQVPWQATLSPDSANGHFLACDF